MKWYTQVSGGDQYVPAQARYAFLLGRQNKLAEARDYLQNVKVQSDEQRAMLIQAEAQLLREARPTRSPTTCSRNALERQPENADLLYDSALAAEKLDKLDVVGDEPAQADQAQARSRASLQRAGLYPRGSHRPAEGGQAIHREGAGAVARGSPSSSTAWAGCTTAWATTRTGWTTCSAPITQRPDAEIAAHLGEVLWAKGRQGRGREGLARTPPRSNPDNDLLRDTMQRFLK